MQNRKSNGFGNVPMPQNPQNVTPEQVQQLLNSLPQADKARIESVLQNKEATQKLLSTPQAQALMKKFGGGK
ncbi:hypothetical protein [Caproicibacterium amylolyticum]|uniref:Uncharacterized protein n=1 Tax=Caproicibacterium amylolyticum TaxID=2766537 RepID=A0A7G9WH82_9FIRM|nr:hypothetical protein [Caproicibacterium amylolyticum]MBE6721031.1 hypothetical protein [Oscillospiraceae bacterium]QNO18044.1 hypothetical protein H6X83_14200 [Caproicibacterium amylolyticum]